MAKDWRVVIDDTGDEFSGWPMCVTSDSEDRSILHQAGFIQEHWGCAHGDGPSLKEALEIAQVVADHMNAKPEGNPMPVNKYAKAAGDFANNYAAMLGTGMVWITAAAAAALIWLLKSCT